MLRGQKKQTKKKTKNQSRIGRSLQSWSNPKSHYTSHRGIQTTTNEHLQSTRRISPGAPRHQTAHRHPHPLTPAGTVIQRKNLVCLKSSLIRTFPIPDFTFTSHSVSWIWFLLRHQFQAWPKDIPYSSFPLSFFRTPPLHPIHNKATLSILNRQASLCEYTDICHLFQPWSPLLNLNTMA